MKNLPFKLNFWGQNLHIYFLSGCMMCKSLLINDMIRFSSFFCIVLEAGQ